MTDVDPTDWDRFVEASDPGSYLQTSAWAAVKAVNGWSAHRDRRPGGDRVADRRPGPRPPAASDAVGLRLRPARPGRRGLDARDDRRASPRRSASDLPAVGRAGQPPPDRPGDRGRRAARPRRRAPLARCAPPAGDRRRRSSRTRRGSSTCAPTRTRCGATCARSGASTSTRRGPAASTVVDADGDRLGEFYRIYRETADRAGFLIRAESAYRDVWDAFAPTGNARLLFAQAADGEPQATLFLVRCGPRVVEPYGGMTAAGAESRANYLLKWEAIRSSREAGATSYDLWGLATGGIAHFKTGFGGREVRYIGAWDLVLSPVGRRAYERRPQRGRVWHGARRRGGIGGGGERRGLRGGRLSVRDATPEELADWDARTVDAPGGHVYQSRAWAEHRRGVRLAAAVPGRRRRRRGRSR